MGCRKLSYNEPEALGQTANFLRVAYAKTESTEKNRTDYYAFGSVARREQTNEDSHYRYGYQGQYSMEDTETGWNSFELREYDAIIGRFVVPDPMKEFASPYVAMGNNPMNLTDPTGGCTDCQQVDLNTDFNLVFGFNHARMAAGVPVAGSEGGFFSSFADSWAAFGNGLVDAVSSVEGFVNALENVEKSILNLNTAGLEFDPAGNAAKWDLYNAAKAGDPSAWGTYAGIYSQQAVMMAAPELAGATFRGIGTAFGPMKQWIRVGPSHSHYLNSSTKLSIRWGAATPRGSWKYVNQIGSLNLRMINQGLRQMKVPLPGWWFKDAGHIHIRK